MSVEPSPASPEIENLLAENRSFPPDPAFTAQANATADLYAEAEADFEAFWARIARERVDWFTPFDTTLEWDLPFAKWFTGGKLNISYNCLDRHVANGLGDKVAYHWVGEPGDTRTLTYADMLREVSKAANALKELGIGTGDRVAIYMPMIPELPIAMLACARLGAPHTVIFGGFSAEALQDRINDAEAKLVITADGGWRRGKPAALKPAVDEALLTTPTIAHTLVVRRLGDALEGGTAMQDGRDVWWHDIVDRQSEDSPAVPLDSEHMLYLLYTSGTTAKPKGIMHTTAGYLVGVSFTHAMVFDIKPDDVYWCAADVGWVTGHSYIVYGSLANATTSVLYEGTPDSPSWERWWQIIEDYKVSVLYCAPTAIRAHMKQGPQYAAKHDLSSLRVLGTVGEPINPEAWLWYHEHIGASKTPIVDTWWQTETGMMMITPLPGVTATKPGSATFPFPGIGVDVVDGDGNSVPLGGGGYLVLTRPWPAMLRGIYGDPERYKQTYWSRFPGKYFAGDGAKRDLDGLPVAPRPRRRRDERVGPPDQHHRGGVRPRRRPAGRRGRGRRQERPDHRPGDLRVRHPQGRRRGERTAGRRAPRARRQGHRPDRQAQVPDVHAGPAQDAVGQDHAPPAARHRRRPHPRRHDHPCRQRGGGDHPLEHRLRGGMTCPSIS